MKCYVEKVPRSHDNRDFNLTHGLKIEQDLENLSSLPASGRFNVNGNSTRSLRM